MASNMESGFTTTLAAKLGAADVEMTVATAPTVTSGRLFLKSGSTKERISYTGVSGTILTGLTRNLSKTADPSTGGTGLSRLAGTTITIVAMHDQLFDRTDPGAITLPGAYTFTGENTVTNKLIVSGANGEIDMSESKKTLGLPQLTTTERLAITPKNGDLVYDTDIGVNHQYTGGIRVTIDTGTPTANASETVSGKVQKATDQEVIDGDEVGTTGAFLFATPSQIKNNPQEILINDDLYMGESGVVGKTVFLEDNIESTDATETQNIGDVTGNTRVAVRVFGNTVIDNTIDCILGVGAGSPSTNFEFRLETDNAGQPSGTLQSANATDSLTTVEVSAGSTPILGTSSFDTPVDNDIDLTSASTDTRTSLCGFKFTALKDARLSQITKHASCTGNTATLYDESYNQIATSSIVSNVASFSYICRQGQDYIVEIGSGGSNYTRVYKLTDTFPITSDNISITDGTYDGAPDGGEYYYNIEQITTEATIGEDLGLTEGTPYRLVMNQTGDTVNASNYFTIAYSSQQTSTRNFVTYNGSSYGGIYLNDTLTPSNGSFWNDSINFSVSSYSITIVSISNETTNTYTQDDTSIQFYSKLTAVGSGGSWASNTFTMFFDSDNYIEVTHYMTDDSPIVPYIRLKVVKTAIEEYNNTSNMDNNDLDENIKIEYDGTDAKVYRVIGGARTLILSYAVAIVGDYTIKYYAEARKNGGAGTETAEASEFYFTNFTYSTLIPEDPNSGEFVYLSSGLFLDQLLAYTNAAYSYKTDLFGILQSNTSLGNKGQVGFEGIDSNQSGNTILAKQYLSDTDGEISETPGTNKYQVGENISDTQIKLEKVNLVIETPTVGASPYTYQNTELNEQKVMITGGTVSSVQYSRDGTTFYTQGTSTNTEVILGPGDYVKTTYSSIPTFTIFNK